MSLVKVVVSNGQQFTVSKSVLEKCVYFKTMFSTKVGHDGEGLSVYADCDGASFELLARLLKYGPDAVPDSSVVNWLKFIMFHDANYLGAPSNFFDHITHCQEELQEASFPMVSVVDSLTFAMPPQHLIIESAHVTLSCRHNNLYPFILKNVKILYSTPTKHTSIDLEPDAVEKTKHTIPLDFLKGDLPQECSRIIKIQHKSTVRLGADITMRMREAQSFAEFCKSLAT